MKFSTKQQGFAVVEAFLILVVLAIVGFTGYFVYHSKQNADKSYSAKVSGGTPNKDITTYEQCKNAAGSRELETYPAQCVTKSGQTFTNTSEVAQYMTVKEWGVKLQIPTGLKTMTYVINTSSVDSLLLDSADISDLAGGNCPGGQQGGFLGFITRNTTGASNELTNQKPTVHVGAYYYYYMGPQQSCLPKSAATQADTTQYPSSVLQTKVANELPSDVATGLVAVD